MRESLLSRLRGGRLAGAMIVFLLLMAALVACDATETDQGGTSEVDQTPLTDQATAPAIGAEGDETETPTTGTITENAAIETPTGEAVAQVGATDTPGMEGTTGGQDTTPTPGTLSTAITGTAGITVTPSSEGEAPVTLPETGQQVTETQEMTETQQLPPGYEGTSVAQVATPGGTLPTAVDITLVQVAEGLVDPINVVIPPDGSGRLFVLERPGIIRIVQDGELLEEPFLDISHLVLSAFLEQGLYDLAFDPDFATNGRFYVHYADVLNNGDSLIVRYTVSDDNPNQADPDSAQLILQIDQPWANHNGGEIEFGPDGYLYIGSGDGGWEGDPLNAGQRLDTLLGKILRIDVNVPAEDLRGYAIPQDNPYAQRPQLVELFGIPEEEFARIHTEARPEIWAWGLRNPWKFNFDAQTGDLYIADVGQNHWEEINFQPAGSPGGENYGWDVLMGTRCHPITETDCNRFGVLPVAEYSHALGLAVVGLGVYRGTEAPDWDGIYFVGDWGSGRIWGLARDDQGVWQFQELLDTDLHITGAGTDEDGNIYVTSCECDYSGLGPFENPPGALWRLTPADQVPEGAITAPTGGQQEQEEQPEATGTPEVGTTPGATPSPGATGTSESTASPLATGTPEAIGTPGAGAGEQVTIDLVAENTQFDMETITVPAGARVVITFTNMDTVAHNFSLYTGSDASESIFVGELVTGPSRTVSYEFDAPQEPGTYWFQCDPHAFTMNGQFIVE